MAFSTYHTLNSLTSKGASSAPGRSPIAKKPRKHYICASTKFLGSARRRTSEVSGTELPSMGHGDSMDTIPIISITGGGFYKDNVYQS